MALRFLQLRRKNVLRVLFRFYLEQGPNHAVNINGLKFFNQKPESYKSVLLQLQEEEMIRQVSPDGHPAAFMVNPKAIAKIRSELDAWYNDTRFLLATLVAVIGWIPNFWNLIT
ncbi:MAG: hypothetical protein MH219_20365 [Marinobacter sp.]|jgi:hypothetical protein|nr:hypothetical protein [Marinobacter sp.]